VFENPDGLVADREVSLRFAVYDREGQPERI